MQDTLQEIEYLLQHPTVKKAEAAIAHILRDDPSEELQAQLLLQRARAHWLSDRPERGIDDLHQVRTISPVLFATPRVQELLADCHFARFERSAIGFADRVYLSTAQDIYRDITQLYPHYNNLGWVHFQHGRSFLAHDDVLSAGRAV